VKVSTERENSVCWI